MSLKLPSSPDLILSAHEKHPQFFFLGFFTDSIYVYIYIYIYGLDCRIYALAVGGEFEILEGRSFALIHPIMKAGLFFNTSWAGYLGWQWRRVRTMQNEINELKKQVKPTPVTPEGTPV